MTSQLTTRGQLNKQFLGHIAPASAKPLQGAEFLLLMSNALVDRELMVSVLLSAGEG